MLRLHWPHLHKAALSRSAATRLSKIAMLDAVLENNRPAEINHFPYDVSVDVDGFSRVHDIIRIHRTLQRRH